ncbi:unnamed protein product, partial [Mesorhabditis spiculigera]
MDDNLYFVNDLEVLLFLWRNYAPKFDNRTYTRVEEKAAIESVEQKISYHSAWRIDEHKCKDELSAWIENNEKEATAPVFSKLTINCAGERERGWIDDATGIKFDSVEPSTDKLMDKNYAQEIELISLVITTAIDQQDVWGTSRLLEQIAPLTLPKLRRMAEAKKLGLVQTLFAYTIDSTLGGKANLDSEEGFSVKEMSFLVSLDRVVDEVQENAHSITDTRQAAHAMLNSAAQFVQKLGEPKCCPNRVKSAAKMLCQQVNQLQKMQTYFTEAVDNEYQLHSPHIGPTYRLLRSLLDRIMCTDVIPVGKAQLSDVFRTPMSVKQPTQANTPVTTIEKPSECTPKAIPRLGLFLNNSTPTPIRPEIVERPAPVPECDDDDENSVNFQTPIKKTEKRLSLDQTPEGRPAKARRRSLEVKPKKAQVKTTTIKTASWKSVTYVIQGAEDAIHHIAAEGGYLDNPVNKTGIHNQRVNQITGNVILKIEAGKKRAVSALQDTPSPFDVHHKMNVIIYYLQKDVESCGWDLVAVLRKYAGIVDAAVKNFEKP